MASGGDPIAAITEAEASGEIAAIYADIRDTFGVRLVNLVWRHLATMPGALPWCWAAARPIYKSGRAAAEAQALISELPLPAPPAFSSAALAAVGVGASDRASIQAILDTYNHTNPMALVVLTALRLRLAGDRGTAMPAPPEAKPAPAEAELPKLLALAEMPTGTAALVRALNRIGERGDGRVLASMYRHLAHWPGFLALVLTQLSVLDGLGYLPRVIDAALTAAERRGRELIGDLPPASGLPAALRPPVIAALDEFTRYPIGRMTPIGVLLRRAMPA